MYFFGDTGVKGLIFSGLPTMMLSSGRGGKHSENGGIMNRF